MRLLCITNAYPPSLKFLTHVFSIHPLNKAFFSRGIEVSVYTTDVSLNARSGIHLGQWYDYEGVKVKYFKSYGYENFSFSPALLLELLLTAGKYDLFYITELWSFTFLAGALAALAHRKPYIVSIRGTLYKEAIYIKSKRKKLFYLNFLLRHLLKRASALHYLTEHEKKEVTGLLGLKNKAIVVPNGVNLSDFDNLRGQLSFIDKYNLLKGKRYILFLGRIAAIKGIDILIGAFSRLVGYYPDLFLVLAGPDQDGYTKIVKKQLNDYGLSERVIFTGLIIGQDKLAAFRDAYVFVLPSYSEGHPLALLEAMACGAPIVASKNVRIEKLLQQNNAALIAEANAEDIYLKIKSLLDDGNLRKEIAKNGKMLVRREYDLNVIADKMIRNCEDAIKCAGSSGMAPPGFGWNN